MMGQKATLPPEPRLQGIGTNLKEPPQQPHVELEQLRADESAILNNYAWVDFSKGIVRIPIDQAIDMVAARRACRRSPARRAGTTMDTG